MIKKKNEEGEKVVSEVVSQTSERLMNKQVGVINFPIPILINLTIANFLNGNFDKSLDICQELIIKICVYLTDPDNFQEPLQFEFVDFLRISDLKEHLSTIINEF